MTKQGRGTDQEVYNGGAVAALDASGGDVALAAKALMMGQDSKSLQLALMVSAEHRHLIRGALEEANWNIDAAGMLLLDRVGT